MTKLGTKFRSSLRAESFRSLTTPKLLFFYPWGRCTLFRRPLLLRIGLYMQSGSKHNPGITVFELWYYLNVLCWNFLCFLNFCLVHRYSFYNSLVCLGLKNTSVLSQMNKLWTHFYKKHKSQWFWSRSNLKYECVYPTTVLIHTSVSSPI